MAKKKTKKTVKKATKKVAKKTMLRKAVKKTPTKKASKKVSVKAQPKTNTINPYLTFKDNCEEVFTFYRSVFGGKFSYVGRFKEMPPMDGMPVSEAEAEKIMHISLPISKETILMGSDSSEAFGHATVTGNNFSISISAKSRKEADRLYTALSEGGKAIMPMSKTFWGSYFGMLTDKFGIQWQVGFGQ
jgi:PhnB protein